MPIMQTFLSTTLSIPFLFSMAFAATAQAKAPPKSPLLTEKTIEYKEGDTVLEGFLAHPKNLKKDTPVVVIVHEWMGLDSYAKTRARMVAGLGYVAFAADIYGKGIRPKDTDEAAKLATKYKTDIPLFRKRIRAAIDTATKLPHSDEKKAAIIGYCFGGTAALEAARAKMPVLGVVSFHGGLSTPNPKETKEVKAKVLVLHGAEDPHVPPKEVHAFEDEMRAAKADWQLVAYGGAYHKFSNPESPYKPELGFAYDEKADRRSWNAMKDFFEEIFK